MAAQLVVGDANGFGEVVLVVVRDQVRDHLGVGVGGELGACLEQALAELGVVLDDPVEDDVDPVLRVEVRVRVVLGDRAVGRPAGVCDSRRRLELLRSAAVRAARDRLVQLGEVPDSADRVDPAVHEQRQAGRVVAAVLEHLEPVQQQVTAGPVADVSDDSTHRDQS